jgi:D-alanine-D-alanine ligase
MKRERPRVLILHHVPPEGAARGAWRESDEGVRAEVGAVAAALDHLGFEHRTIGVAGLGDVASVLAAATEPVVFNLVETFIGAPVEANGVPALGRAFGKACTGSDTPCLAAALDKGRTKAILMAAGLPCPRGVVVAVGERVRPADLPPGPFIVKPCTSDASEGIDARSVVAGPGAALTRVVRRVHEEVGQDALVEAFIGGRELNVSLLERGGEVAVLPLAEIDFSAFPPGRPRIVDYAAKWLADSFAYRRTPRIIPAPLPIARAREVRRLALGAWRALGCRDYARVDFRLDRRGRPWIIEVNPNPDISPDAGFDAGFAAALSAAGIPFEEFVQGIIRNATARQAKAASRRISRGRSETRRADTGGRADTGRRTPRAPAAGSGPVRIRRTGPRDRPVVLAFLAETGFFRPDELDIAREVLDEALAKGPGGHYQSFVADEAGRAVGWVCFGPTPCTVGTFDLYWIGVAPSRQGCGVGRDLMQFAESAIAPRGGRLVVVETSGRAVYDSTRRFYQTLGYREAARIADFYAPGDAKVVYVKPLQPALAGRRKP